MLEILDSHVWVPTEVDMKAELDFIRQQRKEIGDEKLIQTVEIATRYRLNAYVPYSKYQVGAGVLTVDQKIYGGCNSEFVSYSPTNHAEGTAIAIANADGAWKKDRRFIKAVAVAHEGGSGPCGECLQRIVEHADNCLIIVANQEGKIRRITSLKAIFPYNFNPSHLGIK